MLRGKTTTNIKVEIERTKELDEWGIYISTADGQPLTSQQILDAVAESLLLEYGFIEQSKKSQLDS